MLLSMMNIIFLVLLSQLIFITIEATPRRIKYKNNAVCSSTSHFPINKSADRLNKHSPLLLPFVKIGIMRNGIAVSHVNLKLKQTFLANENLPIWILRGLVDKNFLGDNEDGHELNRDFEVMKQLGEFTIYQEPESSSAAVYFHKRREFDGMIGYKYLIQKLPVEAIHFTDEKLIQLDELGIHYRPKYKKHEGVATNYEDLQVGINDQKYLKTYGDRVYDGYPEMLVIVSWELARDLKTIQKSDWHAAVVSYVLTLFNGVDMLYSKLQKTNIQINIAGIIIGEQKESFSFLDECSHDSNKDGKYTKLIDALCTNSNIRRYLSGRKKKIPIDSYDAVIFLTRMVLIEDLSSDQTAGIDFHKISRLRGFSNAVFNLYEVKKKNIEVILTAAVESDKYFRYYPVVAHEMAHLMSVYHDEQPFFTVDGKCCGNIEKLTGSNWCDTCLSWSQISEETFNLFFSSPNCCSFINKPRSLLPPGRHRMLTADEQCQCYGHKSALKFGDFIRRFCYSNLQCYGMNNKYYQTVVPMDGTPQGDNNKVCWQKRSQLIEIF